ncbi:MmcQ/YjbR family DNA-binding protein [Polymorphobacter fuscus]|uniref:MmcQ/YjbR family DNA-binding protein n=1 Tax=Sandarakinorhabdus fusca TaxID=1439888 RepID=UPI0016A74A0A|nr:MmcQ/YjbR family DNA-binding protein [Polymorphobacter fuscus]NJC09674.1 hypothetical protein [Polymorphobacter fuscus]
MTWGEVIASALALPGAERSTSYGRDAIAVRGKMIIVIGRTDDHFVLTTTRDEAEMLMATDPDCFYQTPHYAGWPGVLVRLATADPERVAALVERAWSRRASKAQLAARP